jgi:hypothetical protein
MKINKLINFTDYENINIKTFEDEFNTQDINKYLTENKVCMIKGKFPGSGKTQSIKNFDKKLCLFFQKIHYVKI